jgi:hypothetical protein
LAGRKLFGREEFPKRQNRFAGNLRLPSAAEGSLQRPKHHTLFVFLIVRMETERDE